MIFICLYLLFDIVFINILIYNLLLSIYKFYLFLFILLLQAKALCINPLRPEYLAVAVNDPIVRVYDRRMLCLSGLRTSTAAAAGAAGGAAVSSGAGAGAGAAAAAAAAAREQLPSASWSIRGQVPCDVYAPSCLWCDPFESSEGVGRQRLQHPTHIA